MKVKMLMEKLERLDPNMEVMMHGFDGKPLLFVDGNRIDDTKVALKSEEDIDLKTRLSTMFDVAAKRQINELDFFMDLLDMGLCLSDIEKYVPERYEYSKNFMEEHGLIE